MMKRSSYRQAGTKDEKDEQEKKSNQNQARNTQPTRLPQLGEQNGDTTPCLQQALCKGSAQISSNSNSLAGIYDEICTRLTLLCVELPAIIACFRARLALHCRSKLMTRCSD